jgi:acetyl-CoA acyltransferase
MVRETPGPEELPVRDAVIVDAVRTPIGKRDGALAGWHPVDLAAEVLTALVARTGVDPASVDDVMFGCVNQLGDQSSNMGRMAALAAGWPEAVPGVTVERACGSSQQALHFAAASVMSGSPTSWWPAGWR